MSKKDKKEDLISWMESKRPGTYSWASGAEKLIVELVKDVKEMQKRIEYLERRQDPTTYLCDGDDYFWGTHVASDVLRGNGK